MSYTFPSLAWIVLLPLLGATINGLFGRRLGRTWVGLIAVLCVLFPFLLAVEALITLHGLDPGARLVHTLYTWISVGGLDIPVTFSLDALSAVLTLTVTGVGSLIHLYSVGYMEHDPSHARYFSYLNLFTFAMLILVLGAGLPLLFVGWEGVGLCSYLLIGFWFTDRAKAAAGMKAFVVNRIGDLGFLLGMFFLFRAFGTLEVEALRQADFSSVPSWTLTAACLCLFVGACGKSAQLPLYVWLPDAMAGPTPVSALIHAATMVTAGVYMVCRLGFLFVQSPVAMAVVASVGALTALFAATIAITQNDIKKVLAYSTVSQLGFMFMAAGVGAFGAAVFHLVTHAFFKACLFLGSGSVIHGMEHAQHAAGEHGDPQDIRRMGGLFGPMRITALTFGASTLAIAGFPLTAGFFSKDEVLWRVFSNVHPQLPASLGWLSPTLYTVGLVAALFTAIYMGRLFVLTFLGSCRAGESVAAKLHESPSTMTLPLVVLGLLALVGGFMGVPHAFAEHTGLHLPNYLHHWLEPVVGDAAKVFVMRAGVDISMEWGLTWLSAGIGMAGLVAAFFLWRGGEAKIPAKIAQGSGPVYRILQNRYYVDEIYAGGVIRPLLGLSDYLLHKLVDRFLIDTVLLGIPVLVVKAAGLIARRFQSGNVQWYATVLTVGFAVFFLLWSMGGGG